VATESHPYQPCLREGRGGKEGGFRHLLVAFERKERGFFEGDLCRPRTRVDKRGKKKEIV